MRFAKLLLLMFPALLVTTAWAEIVTRDVEYKDGEAVLQGYLAYDNSNSVKRPGVLIIHQWTGLGEYEKSRARMIAEMGYVAFALDIYGKGIRPAAGAEASQMAGKFKGNRQLFRQRANAGLEVLCNNALTDPDQVAAIGYCFGGTGVLELARSGADVKAIVSFHGGLDSLNPQDGANIKASILILHGAADPTVSQEDIQALHSELETHGVDWEMAIYGHAKHSFTEKEADSRHSPAVGYNREADTRSWRAMELWFQEHLEKKAKAPESQPPQ